MTLFPYTTLFRSVPLPSHIKPIGCRYVFKTKLNSNGEIDKHKARLVAKGYTQQFGLDYTETFSPVAKLTSVKVLLALAAKNNWHLEQLDVHNAFLNGELQEDIYMSIPPGLSIQGENTHATYACKLKRSLYGLKQASRQWNHTFTQFLNSIGFKQSKNEYSLFTRKYENTLVFLLVYVDDIIISGNNQEEINSVKAQLQKRFKIRDLGKLQYFLGLEVVRTSEGIHISQRKYTSEIIEQTGMLGCKPAINPIIQNHKLRPFEEGSKDEPIRNPTQYRKILGKLIYLTITRPDISYAVGIMSQFMEQPTKHHMNALMRIIRYLKKDIGAGLFYSSNKEMDIRVYCDSDFAGCPFTRRSISGYVVLMGDSLISWKSKKQHTVSRSSAEAEYRSIAYTSCEIVWIKSLLEDFLIKINKPISLYCDNQSAIFLTDRKSTRLNSSHAQ